MINIRDDIGEIIISIARANEDFICSQCLKTANNLFITLTKFASVEYCEAIKEQFKTITERDIEEE